MFFDKHGRIPFRCPIPKCKAKSKLVPKVPEKLDDIEANWNKIVRESFWTINEHPDTIHTCGKHVLALNSDRLNFAHTFRRKKTELNDFGSGQAFRASCLEYETGLGMQFDALITGSKASHENRLHYDRKKRAVRTNRNVTDARNLQVDAKNRFLR